MTKEILEQAILDYINEKFKDKVLDKRVQTFFTYSELVDTVLSFAELLNKNIEQLEKENTELRESNEYKNKAFVKLAHQANVARDNLDEAKEHIRTLISCLIDWVQEGDKDYCHIADAEQFIKDLEK